jgi:integrase
VKALFRRHYMTWSERQRIEFQAPGSLANAVRIITETGLRVYKELTPMRQDQIDLVNAMVWIPDSKTENGIAEVALTDLALQAFKDQVQLKAMGRGCLRAVWTHAAVRIRSRRRGAQRNATPRWYSVFSDLRSAFDLRDQAFCWRRRR